jgi:elongation factor G
MADQLAELQEAINETIAETDEVLMDKYFGGEGFSEKEKIDGLKAAILSGSLYPVIVSSALSNWGVTASMDRILKFMPSPEDRKVVIAEKLMAAQLT